MDNEKVYTTSLRLYKKRPIHAQAYRCLKNYNQDIFKTKDEFLAEAVIHFSKYLKQEEDAKQVRMINDHLEQQKEQLLELMKKAVCQVQNEKMPAIIKEAVSEVIRKNEIGIKSEENDTPDKKIQGSGNWEKDENFASFYDMYED